MLLHWGRVHHKGYLKTVCVCVWERVGRKAGSHRDGRHDLSRFRSHNGGKILLPAINYYMGNKYTIPLIGIVCFPCALRDPLGRLIKGSRTKGYRGESKPDLTQSPRLIRWHIILFFMFPPCLAKALGQLPCVVQVGPPPWSSTSWATRSWYGRPPSIGHPGLPVWDYVLGMTISHMPNNSPWNFSRSSCPSA
jgi:hypothetical protein